MGKIVKASSKNKFELNPSKHWGNAGNALKSGFGLDKPKVDTSAQDAQLERQRLEEAKLDEQENRRRKRLLAAATGVRSFTGSPLLRAAPGNRAGSVGANISRAVGRMFSRGGGGGPNRGGSMIP